MGVYGEGGGREREKLWEYERRGKEEGKRWEHKKEGDVLIRAGDAKQKAINFAEIIIPCQGRREDSGGGELPWGGGGGDASQRVGERVEDGSGQNFVNEVSL